MVRDGRPLPRLLSYRARCALNSSPLQRSHVRLHYGPSTSHPSVDMATPRAPFVCTSCARALRAPKRPSTTARAWFSSTARPSIEATRDPAPQEDPKQLPRWAQTPPAMRAPIRMRPMPQQPAWKVNDDPEVLDDVMDRFIGRASGPTVKGRDVLPEELKVRSD